MDRCLKQSENLERKRRESTYNRCLTCKAATGLAIADRPQPTTESIEKRISERRKKQNDEVQQESSRFETNQKDQHGIFIKQAIEIGGQTHERRIVQED